MTGLDQLRSTLETHADAVVDTGATVRVGEVRRRVVVARRRRRAAVAGGVAAVVAVAAGVGLSVRATSQNASPAHVVGVEAPTTLHSLGYTYAYSDSVDGHDGKAVLKLDASSEPRLVSWATSGDDQAVRVKGPSLVAPVVYDVPDFGDFAYVPAGDAYTVTASVKDGEPGLAVYTLQPDRPAGVTQDGVTFRRSIAGGALLGAVIGQSGQSDITVPATATGPGVGLSYYCSGGPKSAFLHIDYLQRGRGGFVEGRGCDDQVPVDGASFMSTRAQTHPGANVGFRVHVTDGPHGPRISDPDLRIGLGVYGLDQNPVGQRGFAPPELEDSGHAWRRVDVARTTPGQTSISTRAPGGRGAVLAVVFGSGHAHSKAGIGADFAGQPSTGFGGGGATQEIIPSGVRTRVYLDTGRLGANETFGVAFYVEDD